MKLKENKFGRGLTQRSRRKLYRRLQGTASLENLLKDEPVEGEAAAEAVGKDATVEELDHGAEGVEEGAKMPAGGEEVKKGDRGEEKITLRGRGGAKEEERKSEWKGRGQDEKKKVTSAILKKGREVLVEMKNSRRTEKSEEEEEEEEGVEVGEEMMEDTPFKIQVEVVEDLDVDITVDVDVEVDEDVVSTSGERIAEGEGEEEGEVKVPKRDVTVKKEMAQKDNEMSTFARELNSLWTFEVNEMVPDTAEEKVSLALPKDEHDGDNETEAETRPKTQETQIELSSSPHQSNGSETDETKKNTTSASSDEGVADGLAEEEPTVVGDTSKKPLALADKLGRRRPSNISFKIRRRKKDSGSSPQRPSQMSSAEQCPPPDNHALPPHEPESPPQHSPPSDQPPQPPPRARFSLPEFPTARAAGQTSNKSQRLLDTVLTKNLRNLRVGVNFPKGRRHSSTPAPQTAPPPSAKDRKTSVTYIKEILRDLRQGLLRTEERPLRETAVFYTKGIPYSDDTYMYDDEVGGAMGGASGVMGGAMGGAGVMGGAMGGVPMGGPMGLHLQHWYDEPPYESDPEDFLIGKDPVREPYVNNFRVGIKEEDVISLRTAGDISVPRDVTKASHVYWSTVGAGPGSNTSSMSSSSRHHHGHHTHMHAHAQQHAHWLEMEMEGGRRLCTPYGPQPMYDNVRLAAYTGSGPAGIRPGGYPRRIAGPAMAGSTGGPDPEYHNLMALRACQGVPGLGTGGRRGVGVGIGGRESVGGDYASDVQSVTSRLSAISVETNRSDPTDLRLSKYTSRSSVSGGSEDGQSNSHSSDYEDQDDIERTGSASLVGRMRGLRRDMQKKISRLKSPRGSTSSSPGHVAAGGGLPSAGGDEKGTPPHLSTSPVDALPSAGQLGQTASGSNRSSLSGGEEAETYTGPFIGRARALVDYQPSPYDRDAIKFKKGDVIDIIAKNPSGLWKGCVGGRVGHFKFILVEEEIEQQRAPRRSRVSSSRGTTRRGRSRTLEELLARLRLSHLVQVFVLNGYEDLEQFREVEAEDLDCLGITDPETRAKLLTAVALLHDADSDPEDLQSSHHGESGGAIHRGDHGRDSGCYTDHRSAPAPPPPAPSLGMGDENNLDTRQSTPSTDTSSGYHSRGAYNIPMGEGGGGGSSTLPRDDGEGLQDSSPPPPPPAPSGSVEPNSGAGSSAPSTPRSYRAQLATVLPASPRPSRYEQQQVDYEAKYVATRSVFERDIVSREVPVSVRSPRRTVNPSLAPSSPPTPSP